MSGNTNRKATSRKPATRRKSALTKYAASKLNKADSSFHIKLKHVLGSVSLLSLLAAFEVFSIPAANGIIDLFYFNRTYAGALWVFMAALSGGVAFYLYGEEKK